MAILEIEQDRCISSGECVLADASIIALDGLGSVIPGRETVDGGDQLAFLDTCPIAAIAARFTDAGRQKILNPYLPTHVRWTVHDR